jgi:hypothetical protein
LTNIDLIGPLEMALQCCDLDFDSCRRGTNLLATAPFARTLTPRDRELLEGMCNCYSVCGEGFEETVKMVASSRGRTTSDVKQNLLALAKVHGQERDYQDLRNKLPADFPF